MSSDLALKPDASILLSISDRTKADALPLIRKLADAGYRMFATEGTTAMIAALLPAGTNWSASSTAINRLPSV